MVSAGDSATFSVTCLVPASASTGTYNNTTNQPQGKLQGMTEYSWQATDNLVVQIPSISINNVTVYEDVGTAVFTVSISHPSTSNVTFSYATVDGTATAGVDYTSTSGTNGFIPIGNTSTIINIPILDDALYEGNENFNLNLSSVVGATGTPSGIGTILDEPSGSEDVTMFGLAGDATVPEGSGANYTLTLSNAFSDPPESDVDVQLVINGNASGASSDAAEQADFTTVTYGGTTIPLVIGTPFTITIPAGSMSQTFTVGTYDDNIYEGPEDYKVSISGTPTGGNYENLEIGTSSVVYTTILDNDVVNELSDGDESITITEDENINSGFNVLDNTYNPDGGAEEVSSISSVNINSTESVTVTPESVGAGEVGKYLLTHSNSGNNGILSISENGNVTFINNDTSNPIFDFLNDGETAQINFEYTVTDGIDNDNSTAKINITGVNDMDYGDAPTSYGSSGHSCDPNLYLGSGSTGDAGDYGSGDASGDVDDGVVSFETWINGTVIGPGYLPDGSIGSVTMDDDTYAVLVQATNNTGTAAQLVGWIDWDRDGAFDDPSERSVTVLDGVTGNVPDGSNNVDVLIYWDGQTKNGTSSFARFRITTDASFKSSSSPSPTGSVNDGEVEDYQINDGALPVELTSFSLENTLDGIKCIWATESEFENLGFILERRVEDEQWQELASYKTNSGLLGQGTTSIPTDYEYMDKLIEPNTTYEYRLLDVDHNGKVTDHSIETITTSKAPLSNKLESFTVLPAYPNPFNPSTTIIYGLDYDSDITIEIYDITGNMISTLLNTNQTQGWHNIEWNGTDRNKNIVPAGIYICRVSSNRDVRTIKLILLK